MSKYWLLEKDGSKLTQAHNYDLILKFLNDFPLKEYDIDSLYFEGDEIDSRFFNQIVNFHISYFIQNSTIQSLTIVIDPISNPISNPIYINDCNIENIHLYNLKIGDISFKHCEIGILDICDCNFSGQLKVFGFSNIKDLIIDDSKVKYFKVSDCTIIQSSINTSTFNKLRFERVDVTEVINFFKQCKIENLLVAYSEIISLSICESIIINGFYILDCKSIMLSIVQSHLTFENDNNNEISIFNSRIKFTMDNVQIQKTLTLAISMCYSSEIYFNRCYFEKYLNFRGPFLINEDDKISTITLEECIFMDLVSFDFDHAENLKIERTLFQRGVFIPIEKDKFKFDTSLLEKIQIFLKINNKSFRYNPIHSSVWCALKNQALSRNDNINALTYKRNEMDSYSNELKTEKFKNGEKLVLWLNRISNNHGLSWEKGIWFTVVVWLLFYSLFKMSCDQFSVFHIFQKNYQFHLMIFDKDFWPDAFEFLWLPQGIKKLSDSTANLSCFTIPIVTFFIIGKILIAYGVFQTVSAFRKHGKQ